MNPGGLNDWVQQPATKLSELKKIPASILRIFAAEDRGITPKDVRKFGAALDPGGGKIERKSDGDDTERLSPDECSKAPPGALFEARDFLHNVQEMNDFAEDKIPSDPFSTWHKG